MSKNKIFPRNLTAKASLSVKGNSAGTRLENGVDNCYPGLEFDQRNLDKSFFPGLRFEFHQSTGAQLVEVFPSGAELNSPAHDAGLSMQDIENLNIYIWALVGEFGPTSGTPQLLFTTGLNGLEVWRRIHDLNPGRIAILLGAESGFSAAPTMLQNNQLVTAYNNDVANLSRNSDGVFQYLAIATEREKYLDDFGVININVYEPGNLTKTLCSPWQHDFRDCGCFYWASNKPDIVTSADGSESEMNFMRRNRADSTVDDPINNWTQDELTYDDLINGIWNELPVILNDRESEVFSPDQPGDNNLLTRDQVVKELQYLATVEHALCVEYLYAHYSIDAPLHLPDNATPETIRKYSAAREIFNIAVDEMRHFRWVNEALVILNEDVIIDRANEIKSFNRPFSLERLTSDQLDWFIQVEKSSQDMDVDGSIDGMYVKLLQSIDKQPDQFPQFERLKNLFKLIIDEGEDHFERFTRIKEHLDGLSEQQYLRSFSNPGSDRQSALLKLADQNYHVMLGSLEIAFGAGNQTNGTLLTEAIRVMRNLHSTAHILAPEGVDIKFNLPTPTVASFTPPSNIDKIEVLKNNFMEACDLAISEGTDSDKEVINYQIKITNEVLENIKKLISQ